MRTIKAKNIESGMTIEWASEGLTKKAVVKGVGLSPKSREVTINVAEGYVHLLDYVCTVAVVEEPKNNQPPEPTALGARVMLNGIKLIRMNNKKFPWYCLGGSSFGYSWNGLCEEGQVIIVDADPWWPSSESDSGWSNVPQHIEGQWPKNDGNLREYKWLDSKNNVWVFELHLMSWRIIYNENVFYTKSDTPTNGPWDKVEE